MAKKVTVLGAGNAGHAAAFEISLNGQEVMLFEHPNFAKSLDGIRQKGGIEAVKELTTEGKIVPAMMSGFAKITGLTTDPKEAMDFADIVVMLVPQFAQETIFKLMMPYLRDGQIFVVLPGNFGSMIFRKLMKEGGINKKVTFVETTSIPYAVRVIAPGTIYIEGKKSAFSAASLPASEINNVIEALKDVLFLKIIPLKNVLEVWLSNPNMIMHVATATLGMGPMESRQGKIQFYAEGCSPSVAKVLEKEDEERLAVGKAYGLDLMSFVDVVNNFYELNMKSIRDFAEHTPIHNRMPNDSPKSPKERYISEDCPCGLVPVYDFGKAAGVACPTMEAIIRIDNIYNDADYFKSGITLQKLGLSGMSKEQILDVLK
ncbi:MAG: NAD/NADP octopine/nopaline dehydrogenase family protein [Candidatus Omnitrophica bacterium]|nr:NAD/NADP octopine/nopaline dehydrogenase family protein [Candidatus Omnitrophota bacterium]MBU1869470.1 NAD/NADP octopine/nopaline dehydrogenase family protein [Candidatus Omnitrophota bacterium]